MSEDQMDDIETIASIAESAVDIWDFFEVQIINDGDSERMTLDNLMSILAIADLGEYERILDEYWPLFEWMNYHENNVDLPPTFEEELENCLYNDVWLRVDEVAEPYGYKLVIDDNGNGVSLLPDNYINKRRKLDDLDDGEDDDARWGRLQEELY